MSEEKITIRGVTYRIDWSPRFGWIVLVGSFLVHQGDSHDECLRWIYSRKGGRRL